MSDDLEAGVRIGDFRIERRLGAGGMGIVYLARQVSLDRPVALKVLGPALNREADIARFQREAQAVARLHHPGIAGVHYIGQDRHVCYIAMEFVEGVPLREVIDRLATVREGGQTFDAVLRTIPVGEGDAREVRFDQPTAPHLPPPAVAGGAAGSGLLTPGAEELMRSPGHVRRSAEVVRDAALALGHAHERGVVHRDIKPENLLLDRRGEVHLIDFGLARFFEDVTLTSTGALVGTPMYMSPEQVTGRFEADPRTDVYSLGLVLYELLTLRRPVTAPTREALLRQVVTKALPPVGWRNRAVPRELEAVVHKATARDPDERYPDAAGLAADLQNYLDGKPVAAPPYRYRFDRHEIAAERPEAVVVVAGMTLLFAVIAAAIAVGAVYNLRGVLRSADPARAAVEPLAELALAVGFGAGCVGIGFGLLAGRSWARWASALPWLGAVGTLAGNVVGQNDLSGEDAVEFVGLAVGFTLLYALLLLRRTRDWFRLASRLRAEHQWRASPAS
jgi:serine/threonine protein kinase